MWPEVHQVKQEKRYELVLSGEEVNSRIEKGGGVDAEVYKLTQLNFLRISKTPLKALSDDIGLLSNLGSLILQANKLTNLPETIGNLSKLKLLDVSFNCLESLPDSIDKLSSLSSLNACSNKLSCLPSIENLTNLAILDASHNEITEFPEICCESLAHLIEVKLNDNEIKQVLPNLQVLPLLKNLDIANNKIQTVPGEIADCPRLKDINLKGNPLSDRHFKKVVEADRCTPKQVLGNIKQHCPRVTDEGKGGGGGGGKGKKGKKGKSKGKDDLDELSNELRIISLADTNPVIQVSPEIKEIRPFIVSCILQDVDLSGENFKKFITSQTKLHDGICDKRMVATIATHDLAKIKGPLKYVAHSPESIRIHPLLRGKEITARELYDGLENEAEAQRKQLKRNNVSGIHRYLHIVKPWKVWPCLENADGVVISLPPITNAEETKITPETKNVFVEVTSSTSLKQTKEVMDALISTALNLGIGSEKTANGNPSLNVQQVRVEDDEGQLKVLYPSRTDLNFEGQAIRVVQADK